MNGRAPGPVLLVGAGVCTLAFSTDHPFIIGALLVVALVLHHAARASRFVLVMATVLGLGVALLNPFVQASGELILFELPRLPIFDMQVTLEEVVAGLTLGARAAAVTIVVMATLALADPDRLLELASRLMPRSALAASIAARLVPTFRRDAQSLVEASRLRGRSPRSGGFARRAQAAATLALPLVGSALDRSIDVAEAMAARGYGAGPRTRRPGAPLRGSDRLLIAAGVALLALGAAAVVGAVGTFRFFPTMSTPTVRDATAAVACLALGAITGLAARR